MVLRWEVTPPWIGITLLISLLVRSSAAYTQPMCDSSLLISTQLSTQPVCAIGDDSFMGFNDVNVDHTASDAEEICARTNLLETIQDQLDPLQPAVPDSAPADNSAPEANVTLLPPSDNETDLPHPIRSLESETNTTETTVMEEIPRAVPSTPLELLSFNEWREKYVAEPESSNKNGNGRKGAGLGKKVDERGNVSGTRDDLVRNSTSQQHGNEKETEAGLVLVGGTGSETESPSSDDAESRPSQEASPIQPLANVGSGDPLLDPLIKLKDRSNYALFDCSAQVHRSSSQSKGASSILSEKKDRYMLTPCQADKFVEVELCDEIRIDTIVLANFEFFSSMFKHFSIKVSMHYPGRLDEWHDLGTFRARNIRGVQVFHPIPLGGWYRYMRIDFLSHYGSEYYCPVSLLRVYGATQLEAYRLDAEQDAKREAELADLAFAADQEEIRARAHAAGAIHVDVTRKIGGVDSRSQASTAQVTSDEVPSATTSLSHPGLATESATDSSSTSSSALESESEEISTSSATTSATPVLDPASAVTDSAVDVTAPTTTLPQPSPAAVVTTSIDESSSTSGASFSEDNVISTPSFIPTDQTTATTSVAPITDTASPSSTAVSVSTTNTRSSPATESVSRTQSRNDTRPITNLLPVSQPNPGDSIYGTIMKRLAGLEQSSNLAIQYMDAQSDMLRELLANLDRRLAVVEGNRNFYDHSIKATLTGLERDRVSAELEQETLAFKLNALEEEMRFERKLGVAQLLSLLALCFFVAVTRGSPSAFFDFTPRSVPFVPSVIQREEGRIDVSKRDVDLRRKTPRTIPGLPPRRVSTVARSSAPRRQLVAPLRTSNSPHANVTPTIRGPPARSKLNWEDPFLFEKSNGVGGGGGVEPGTPTRHSTSVPHSTMKSFKGIDLMVPSSSPQSGTAASPVIEDEMRTPRLDQFAPFTPSSTTTDPMKENNNSSTSPPSSIPFDPIYYSSPSRRTSGAGLGLGGKEMNSSSVSLPILASDSEPLLHIDSNPNSPELSTEVSMASPGPISPLFTPV